ncbi:MAG: glycosyltransferase family 4 protein [Clostridiales bacterium]|nr:glycosyltransferase family 4 protein [Clostridiales bacterium]
MTVTFVSNYINHHQIPFSDACYEKLGEGYHFIQTEPMETERVAMGWSVDIDKLPYVRCWYKQEKECRELIMESDIVIFGWTGREDIISERLEAGKPTIRVSERLYREGQWKAISPRGLLRKYKEHTKYRKAPVCLLCAGAYVASDFHIIRAYPDKLLRFGYFPETVIYTEGELEKLKEDTGRADIVWAGRFMPLKHPEYAVRIAEELKNENKSFHIHMVGSGEMDEELKRRVTENDLEEYFTFYGYTEPKNVRKIMEKCHIHLFTSNYLEGWGAVVNEAMNSGCAVVANVEAGAVPFLIKHGENGLVYRNGSYEDFSVQVKKLVENPELRKKLGKEAYNTIVGKWNAEYAAKELLRFCGDFIDGKVIPAKEGPLSPAPVIAPGKMYEKVIRHKL